MDVHWGPGLHVGCLEYAPRPDQRGWLEVGWRTAVERVVVVCRLVTRRCQNRCNGPDLGVCSARAVLGVSRSPALLGRGLGLEWSPEASTDMASSSSSHPGAIVTGRSDLHAKRGAKHRWWDTVDPTFPVHVERDHNVKMGADEQGNVPLVGFPVQKEWSGSWREFMAEAARPTPNTMSSLHYTMQQTPDAYIYNITTHWNVAQTSVHFDEVTVEGYRPVAYAYLTGPPPKASGNYGHDGPRGEKDMNRGRITLPRGADLAQLRKADSLLPLAELSKGSCILKIPKAPKDESVPTAEYVAPEETGRLRQTRKLAAQEADARGH